MALISTLKKAKKTILAQTALAVLLGSTTDGLATTLDLELRNEFGKATPLSVELKSLRTQYLYPRQDLGHDYRIELKPHSIPQSATRSPIELQLRVFQKNFANQETLVASPRVVLAKGRRATLTQSALDGSELTIEVRAR